MQRLVEAIVRNSVAFLAAMALGAGPAMAQQTIDEVLTQVRVFDCALGGDQAIYVFRTAADGAVRLVGDEAAPVRATEKGLTIMSDDGLLEVSDGAYHVYGAGSAESGTCAEITGFAHALYPAMTQAYTPDATGGTVAEQAAAAALADLTVQTERALADTAAAQAGRDAMQSQLETRTNELAAALAETDDLSAKLATALADMDQLQADIALLEKSNAGLSTMLSETKTDLGQTSATLETAQAELEELRTLHATTTAAATDLQGQLGTTSEKLAATEADNRTLVATVAGLNSKVSDLGASLRSIRSERDAALAKADTAGSTVVSSASLTNAAIARIATLQGRSQNAVRSELCRIIGRGGGC